MNIHNFTVSKHFKRKIVKKQYFPRVRNTLADYLEKALRILKSALSLGYDKEHLPEFGTNIFNRLCERTSQL